MGAAPVAWAGAVRSRKDFNDAIVSEADAVDDKDTERKRRRLLSLPSLCSLPLVVLDTICRAAGSSLALSLVCRDLRSQCEQLPTLEFRDRLHPRNLAAICAVLRRASRMPHVLHLRIEGFGESIGRLAADGIGQAKHLKTLYMAGIHIDHALATALGSLPTLTSLTLLRGCAGRAPAGAFVWAPPVWAQALRSLPHSQLHTLNLGSNDIGNEGALVVAEALRSMPHSQLQTLNLHNNSIGNEGAMALAEALRFAQKLQTLDLHFNNIGAAGACAVADTLRSLPLLTTLDLGWNILKDEGACAVAQALPSLPHSQLTTLNLTNNFIYEEGAVSLAKGLSSLPHSHLTTLDLSFNRILEAGARAVAEALRYAPQLQILILSNNDIGDAGAFALAEALRSLPHSQLKTLSFGGNHIGDAPKAAIRAAAPLGCMVCVGM